MVKARWAAHCALLQMPPELNKLSGDITASIYDTANGSSSNELTSGSKPTGY